MKRHFNKSIIYCGLLMLFATISAEVIYFEYGIDTYAMRTMFDWSVIIAATAFIAIFVFDFLCDLAEG
jgi:hypothetical protein